MARMKIGVLGTGDVGRTLAAGFRSAGHDVAIGTRDPDAGLLEDWSRNAGSRVRIATFAGAAGFGDVLVFAIGWAHAEDVIRLAGPESFSGKVVLDASNPLAFERDGEPPVLVLGRDDSGGEQLQRWLPEARVVKCFNTVGYGHMVEPDFNGEKPDLFLCGNDEAAKATAGRLAEELGWPPPIDLGDISRSRYLEPMAMAWIVHFFDRGFDGNHAFKLLRK